MLIGGFRRITKLKGNNFKSLTKSKFQQQIRKMSNTSQKNPVKRTDDGIEIAPTGTHRGSIIWLHGLGDSSEGFFPLFSYYVSRGNLDGIKIILPDAPQRPITLNGGLVMRAWYDIAEIRKEDEDGSEKSARFIKRLVDKESKEVGSDKVLIGGFSQGGAMATSVGFQYESRLASIISCSGYILPSLMKKPLPTSNINTDFYYFHGKLDQMVPIAMAENSYQQLRKHGALRIHKNVSETQAHDMPDELILNLLTIFRRHLFFPTSKV